MMRRMEARISSIDGSCAFAGWFMPSSYNPCVAPLESMHPRRITRRLDIYSDRSKYGTAMRERNRGPVDTHTSRRRTAPESINYFPSGVRTPTQVSRT